MYVLKNQKKGYRKMEIDKSTPEAEVGTSDYDEFTDMLNSELDYLEKKYQHKLSTTEYLFCMKKAKYLERVA